MIYKLHFLLLFFVLQACATKTIAPSTSAPKDVAQVAEIEQQTEGPRLPVFGWLEHARLAKAHEHYFRVKLDPGAKTSSLHATNIKRFKRKGKRMVRFTFEEEDRVTGKKFKLEFEKPLVRTVKIKRHRGKSMVRPVVKVEFYFGEQLYEADFTLTDRSRFHYPMLLGRRFLKDVALVDSGKIYLLGDPTGGRKN